MREIRGGGAKKLNELFLTAMQSNKDTDALIDLLMVKNQFRRDKLSVDLKAIQNR